ncbi:hypothetical protein FACS1894196_2610 [Clostridia bacterium]|nr:hypothetical protein FACS1894196_2610 [Clostridia bacterium]
MQCNRYTDPKAFYRDTFPILMRHEAQNTLPLGNVVLGNNGGEAEGWRDTRRWFMATVTGADGGILLSAIMTPPFNITMYETDNLASDAAVGCLCEYLVGENIAVPGVTSESALAERFARAYTDKKGMAYQACKNLRIYTLEAVNERIPPVGPIRRAEKKDLCFLPYWRRAFQDDCALGEGGFDDAVFAMEREIKNGTLYLLMDGGMPVSMASVTREVVNGRCVGMVYTPPYFREKGYASACVAQVSETVLESGYRYVSLFTDLANPTSNSIYQKIGYRAVCDYDEVEFVEKSGAAL